MKTKQVLQSLVFVLIASGSTLALSQTGNELQARDDGGTVRDSAFPWSPVGIPFIE